ncbi:hypothetical protein AAIA72_00795 [Hahella sp. SMD15-11]|uniref:Bacterial virulence factor lipase N-terminal domain-containing protein n=1 Tax=Thermohahella caldifontis TaxID=3142973 RepID=A0AB39UX31_9GAMM
MFKKTLLSMAVASAVVLSGCGGSNPDNAGATTNITNPIVEATEGRVYPLFNPVTGKLPLPNDLIFDQIAKDGTFHVNDTSPPVTTALREISGASTVAPIDVALNGTIDASTVDGEQFLKDSNGNLVTNSGVPVANPNQNVFLLELDYASGDPVQGLSIAEPPTIPLAAAYAALVDSDTSNDAAAAGTIIAEANDPSYKVSVVEQSGHSVIRIHPLKPLDPKKRYVVVVTNEVKDANGQPIVRDPMLTNLIDTSLALPSASLSPVRDLVTKLWLELANNYFQINNSVRAQNSMTALSKDNVALAFSFTTSGDEKVLEYIANPTAWFADSLTNFVRVKAAKAVVDGQVDADADGDVDYTDVKLTADAAVSAFPDSDTQAALPTIFGAGAPCNGYTGSTAINCLAGVLATVPSTSGGFADLLPTPKDRSASVSLDASTTTPAALVSALVGSITGSADAMVVQGSIELPYYLGIPSGTDGSSINSSSWVADDTLATAMNTAFSSLGLSIPQADASKTKVVNYIFPFPKQTDADPSTSQVDDLKVPMLVMYPKPTSLGGTWNGTDDLPVVVFQHGITTDRSAALSVGSVLASKGFIVVAIDMPLHGVDASGTDKTTLATGLLAGFDSAAGNPAGTSTTADNIQALVDGTYVTGVLSQLATPCGTSDVNTILSGACDGTVPGASQWLGFAIGAENAVKNNTSIIPGLAPTSYERHFDFTADASLNPVPMDYTNGVGSSGSLFINLKGFTNSRDKLRQAQLDLLNLFQSLKTLDVNGDGQDDVDESKVYFAGHSLGTVVGSAAVAVANSTPVQDINAAVLLAPASGITKMLENSPGFSPTILGGLQAAAGLTQGDENLETFFRVIQATIDAADPINWADNLKAGGKGVMTVNIVGTEDGNGNTLYKSDQTNVIEAAKTLLNPNAPTARDYLAGALPFSKQLGAKLVTDSTVAVDGTPDILALNLGYGAHGTFVLPDPTAAADELARQSTAFGETMLQMVEFFLYNGELNGPVDATNGRTGSLSSSLQPIIIDKPMDDLKQLN